MNISGVKSSVALSWPQEETYFFFIFQILGCGGTWQNPGSAPCRRIKRFLFNIWAHFVKGPCQGLISVNLQRKNGKKEENILMEIKLAVRHARIVQGVTVPGTARWSDTRSTLRHVIQQGIDVNAENQTFLQVTLFLIFCSLEILTEFTKINTQNNYLTPALLQRSTMSMNSASDPDLLSKR